MCLDESIRDALVSFTPPEKIVNQSFEVMFEDALKFLGIHIVDAPFEMCDDDGIGVRSKSREKSRRRLRKVKAKLERMKLKMTKRSTSPIYPLKRTH